MIRAYCLIALLLCCLETNADLADDAGEGRMEAVKKALADNPNIIKEMEEEKKSVLRYAANKGQVEMIEFLINKGAKVDHVDTYGKTALFYAASMKQLGTVKMLVKHGANINAQDKNKTSVLHLAALKNAGEVITFLLSLKDKNGKRIAKVDVLDRYKITPLIESLRSSQVFHGSSALALIKGGANVNAKDRRGNTPLYFAAQHKEAAPVVKALIEKGADINAVNKSKESVLYKAVRARATKVVELLLKKGAKIDQKTMKYAEGIDDNKIIDLLDKYSK